MRCVNLSLPLAVLAIAVSLPACAGPDTASHAGTEASPDVASSPRLPPRHEVAAAKKAIEAKQAKLAARGPKGFNKPDKAMQFYLDQRLPAGEDRLPIDHLRRVRDQVRERERGVLEQAAAGNPLPGGILNWKWLGPGNIGGRTRALVIDPDDPEIMYAGGVAGGIWKSTDAGASWNVADDLMINLAVTSLAMDPDDHDVLYAGTGEGFYLASVFVQGLGIFKSVDAGATWTQLSGTVSGVPTGSFYFVNKIVVSPNDSNRIYAATRTGIWRSLDAGQTWDVVLSNPVYNDSAQASNGSLVGFTDLAIRQDKNPDVLFTTAGSLQADGLYRSDDGGNTWLTYIVPTNMGRTTLAFAPSDNDILYMLMADNGTGGALGQLVEVYRSDDGGNNFTGMVDLGSEFGPWLLSNLILATGCLTGGTYSQGWYDNIIAVDPVDPDVVWVGGVDIFRSDDGGVTWGIPGYWIFYTVDPTPPYYVHPDHHTIVFHPDYDGVGNQTMYVGNDGGLFRTENARAATSQEDCPLPGTLPLPAVEWESLNNGYGVTQFYHGDSAVQADTFVGGAQDNGTNRVQAKDTPNDWKLIFGGDGGYVAIDPRDPLTMYIEYHDFPTIQKSVDGGDTFDDATNGITDTDGIFITPMAMSQVDPDVLWTGGSRPWRTKDAAASWQPAGTFPAGPDFISAIAIAPSNKRNVYMGFANGYIVRSTNALDVSPNWNLAIGGLIGGWISSIAVDPNDPKIAYCTVSSYGVPHVMRTANGGLSWTSIDGIGVAGVPDIPAHWIAVRPCHGNHLYVGTELGVFVSEDSGATWAPANIGLANTVVESLDFRDKNTLVAFTHGRGAYMTKLKPCKQRPYKAVPSTPMK